MSLCGQFTAIHLFIYTHIWRVCPFLWKKRWCRDSITLKWPPGGRGMTEWMDDVISHIVKHCVYQQSINNTGWTSGPKKSREIEILNFCSSDWYLISYWYIALRIQKKGTLSHQRRGVGNWICRPNPPHGTLSEIWVAWKKFFHGDLNWIKYTFLTLTIIYVHQSSLTLIYLGTLFFFYLQLQNWFQMLLLMKTIKYIYMYYIRNYVAYIKCIS